MVKYRFGWAAVSSCLGITVLLFRGAITAAPPPVAARAQLRVDGQRLLAKGYEAARSMTHEGTKAEVLAELSVAYARAGETTAAKALANGISVASVKGRALSLIAAIEVQLGNAAGARQLAESIIDQVLAEQVVFAVAAAQADSGDAAGASATLRGLGSPVGQAMALVLTAELRAKAGDGAGYRQTAQEARDLIKSLPTSPELLLAARELVSVQMRLGDVSGAVATANEWQPRRFSNLYVEIVATQGEAGDVAAAAKTTAESARFGQEGFTRAWTRVADAQGKAGKFAEARESLERVPNKDQKLLSLAYLAAQAGDLSGGKAAAEAIATGGKLDDDRRLLYGRAVAPLVVLQTKIEGFASGEKWVETVEDPAAKALSYGALAGLRYMATSQEYRGFLAQTRSTDRPASSPVATPIPATRVPTMAVSAASPAARPPATPLSSSLVTGSLPGGGSVKGKFHLFIDDYIRLYVNGVEVFASNVLTTGQSKEIELKANDHVVAQVKNGWGGRGLMLIFVSTDQKRMINFPHTAFKTLLNPEAADFTPAEFQQGKLAKEDKGFRAKPLPYKNQSDLVWGEADVCVLGAIIRAEMFQPVSR